MGSSDVSLSTTARVWAGDGDDEIDVEYGWYGAIVNGGRGDDTITYDGAYPSATGTSALYGGLGDDLFQAGPDFEANSDSLTLTLDGGAGKNRYDGFDGVATLNINGGEDDEVIVAGDNLGTGNIMAGAGDDIVYGGSDAGAMTPGMMDLTVDLGDGNDRFYGGDYGDTETIIGGLGNDMIFAGQGQMTGAKVYGD